MSHRPQQVVLVLAIVAAFLLAGHSPVSASRPPPGEPGGSGTQVWRAKPMFAQGNPEKGRLAPCRFLMKGPLLSDDRRLVVAAGRLECTNRLYLYGGELQMRLATQDRKTGGDSVKRRCDYRFDDDDVRIVRGVKWYGCEVRVRVKDDAKDSNWSATPVYANLYPAHRDGTSQHGPVKNYCEKDRSGWCRKNPLQVAIQWWRW